MSNKNKNELDNMYISNLSQQQLLRFLKSEFMDELKKEVKQEIKSEVKLEVIEELRGELKAKEEAEKINRNTLYTIQDLMKIFNKSRPSIYKMIKEGKLIRHDFTSRSPRFKKEDVEKLISISKQKK